MIGNENKVRLNSGSSKYGECVSPFINGAPLASESEATIDVVNPSTGRRLMSIPAGCQVDVDRAVASARAAFDDGRWSATAPSFRKGILRRFAELIERDAVVLDTLDALEMGKPVSERFADAKSAAGLMQFYSEALDKATGDLYVSDKSSLVLQRLVPRGVVAAVVPWNFPAYNAVLKIAPALAAGNCVILKPSELSTQSACLLCRLAVEAGLPTGVLNLVPGMGEIVGRALGLHSGVDMISFTGSSIVGKKMLEYSGLSNMKVVVAECGGKSPHIVFADGVSVDVASDTIARALVTNQGQICSVGSRLLVQKSLEEPVLQKIAQRMKEVVIGDALNPATTFGPIASSKQFGRVMHYIEGAEQDGARLVAGGRAVRRDSGGYFVEPTVFAGVKTNARIAQEEIFGPVLAVMTFEDEQEAVRLANSTVYGLSANVWTASLSTGIRMAKAIRSSVRVFSAPPSPEGAGHMVSFEPGGQSGIGTEAGLAGMESYMRRQSIWIDHG